jgi:hypothetical protein
MSVKSGLLQREEHGLRAFENRVLRGVFGSKGEKVVGRMKKTV